MAKTVQKELSFAQRLTDALNAIEAAQAKVQEAQEEYDAAKQALSDELKDLPGDHPLRLLTSSNGAARPASGKRTRVGSEALEEIRGSIVAQLKASGKPLAFGQFDKGDVKESTFRNQIIKLKEAGEIEMEGQKKDPRYNLAK